MVADHTTQTGLLYVAIVADFDKGIAMTFRVDYVDIVPGAEPKFEGTGAKGQIVGSPTLQDGA